MKGNGGNRAGEYEPLGYRLIGCAFEVYNELGAGFLEEVYQEALERVLTERGVPFVSQPRLEIWFRGEKLEKYYLADLMIGETIIVELKAVKELAPEHAAQLLNELRATKKRIGYLINFGAFPQLQWSRRML